MKLVYSVILIITLNQLIDQKNTFAQTIHLDSIAVVTDSSVTDTINISLMVAQQIEQAKLKSELEVKMISEKSDSTLLVEHVPLQNENTDTLAVIEQTFAKQENLKVVKEDEQVKNDENGIDFKFAVMSGAFVIAIGFVSVRRIRLSKKTVTSKLKKNINLMREEKIFKVADKKLSQLRGKLKMSTEHLGNVEKSVSATAKNLNIAKGELMLAAKIKSFELSKSCSPK